MVVLGPVTDASAQLSGKAVLRLLQSRGPLADAFYACLLNGLAQGLSLKQIQDECETKLTLDGKGGLKPGRPDAGFSPAGRSSTDYDPASITAKCAAGNPRVAQGGRTGQSSVQVGWISVRTSWGATSHERYTYGGKGETNGYVTNERGEVGITTYRGLTKEQAQREKQAAIDAWTRASQEYDALVERQTAELKAKGLGADAWQNDPKMKAEREAAKKKVEKAARAKDADPNAQTGGISRTAASSECEDALQRAREVVGECQLSGWRSGPCQRLLARMHGCADAALIYVDPEAGYTCRPTIDPGLVRQAWVERCRELKRPAPGGPDPCAPPKLDRNARFVTGDAKQVCGGPQVYVTPDNPSPACVKELKLASFGKSTHQIYVWALNNLGGPIVVFGPRPGTNPSPRPGPEPRPAPKAATPVPTPGTEQPRSLPKPTP